MKGYRQLLLFVLFPALNTLFAQNSALEVKTLIRDFRGNGSIAIAKNGDIYVNEYGTANADISGTGKHVFVINPEGNSQVLLNTVSGAVGNTLGPDGTYYFNNGNSIHKSDLMSFKDGELTKIATLEGFSGDILMDKLNTSFYIPSYTLPVLHKISMDGTVEKYIEDDRLKGVTGITYGEGNTMYLSNFTTGKIFKVEEDKAIQAFAQIPVTYPGYVIGYITYFEGFIYATGYGSNQIYRINQQGKVYVLAGSGEYNQNDATALKAGFITPNGIEIDAKRRRLYITQNGNGRSASLRYIDLPKEN